MLNHHNILLFSGLLFSALSVYLIVSTLLNNTANMDSLEWSTGNSPSKSKSGIINFSRPLVHSLTLKHALKIKNVAYRKKLEHLINKAGISHEINADEFIGYKILWGLGFPLFLLVLNFALQLGIAAPIILVVGLLGFFVPDIYCNTQIKKRSSSIITDLPFFIDLLALSTEAGLDFINAIQRIVEKAEHSNLADEFAIVLKDIKLGGTRAEALRGFAKRTDLPETISFSAVVIDADYTGASISQVLKDQSEQMRLERFVRAEKAGAKASQAILLPIMFLILPAVFIMLFGPAALQFASGGQ